MFFQEPTPDTSGYMIAGYVVAFLVMALYVASLYLRERNLKRDMTMLQEMDEQAATSEPARPSESKKSTGRQPNKTANPVTKSSGTK
jgi:hypothetical protein